MLCGPLPHINVGLATGEVCGSARVLDSVAAQTRKLGRVAERRGANGKDDDDISLSLGRGKSVCTTPTEFIDLEKGSKGHGVALQESGVGMREPVILNT